jgi:hypothetical protein
MVARILSGEGVDFEGARSNRNPGPREDLRFFVISSLGEDLGVQTEHCFQRLDMVN